MREVRVHGDEGFVTLTHGIEQRVLVRASNPTLARTLHACQLRISSRFFLDDLPSAIGRIVVHYQDVGVRKVLDDLIDQSTNVLPLIVAGCENE